MSILTLHGLAILLGFVHAAAILEFVHCDWFDIAEDSFREDVVDELILLDRLDQALSRVVQYPAVLVDVDAIISLEQLQIGVHSQIGSASSTAVAEKAYSLFILYVA